MRSKHYVRWIALMAVLLSGCAATRQYPAPPIIAIDDVRRDRRLSGDRCITVRFSQPVPTVTPRNVLVLSGGGMNGAYTAGVLKGWTASGTRPQFDVVTGISTGALIAPYAFLGPEYDAELERLYTSMRQENVFRPRLLWLDSLVSSEPLEQQIAAGATPEILQRDRRGPPSGPAALRGNDQSRYEEASSCGTWGLSPHATTAESRTLFQKVLLASCSIPGLLPPVPIDIEIDGKRFTELHVDGGVTACVFLQPAMLGIGPNGEQPSEANPISVHVIVAGKLHQTAAPTKRELFSIAGESMNAVLQAKMEGELTKLFMLARYAKSRFQAGGHPARL